MELISISQDAATQSQVRGIILAMKFVAKIEAELQSGTLSEGQIVELCSLGILRRVKANAV